MSGRANTSASFKENNISWFRIGWVQAIGVLILFVALAYGYMYPAAFEGRVLYQVDGAAAVGTGRDAQALKETSGHISRWTGSLFGGMPMYQISPSYPSVEPLKDVGALMRLEYPFDLMPGDTYLLLMMLLGGYVFMRSWGTRRLLSVLGAILWTFSSYFLILIDAGHLWKLTALAYIPPTLAALVLAYQRRKYWLGFVTMGGFTALQILSNHIQMSYYFAFVMLAMVIAWAIEAAKQREWKHFGRATVAILAGGLIGIAINGSNLYHTWEYSKETMRGGREITVLDKDAQAQVNTEGLNREYITQWSYGIDEMLTFLIPDAKGGASGYIGMGEPALSKASRQGREFVAQQNRYWGDQPFTAGPVYVGAFVLALAIFGMITTRGPMKWALIAVMLLTVMLSWGHNFMGLTNFFIDYIPMYDKFRTPSSILVVAELIIPLFAVWGLASILREPQILREHRTASIISLVLTGGIALAGALIPSLLGGSFLSDAEQSAFAQYVIQAPELGMLVDDLKQVRADILRVDAVRSLIYILIGVGIILLYSTKKLSKTLTASLITLLCLVDLWSVDKRYLNDGKYLPQSQVTARVKHRTPVDDEILKDTTQYRVMNLTVNTFNDATTSYNHRSIGGYHAAKLQRYQDLIEGYLVKQDINVLRALNTKYYIVPDSVRGVRLLTDEETYGDGWFVSRVQRAKDADEEFTMIGQVPLDEVAIVQGIFAEKVTGSVSRDSLSTVSLTSYRPDHITYRTSNRHDGLAVFSEIYYPHGWRATIDGTPADILRVDYTFRGLLIPAGEHDVVFDFHPQSLYKTEAIAYIAGGILALSAIGLAVLYVIRKRRESNAK